MRRKLMIVVGTRPEAIKLFPLVEALRALPIQLRVCATGQHRELLVQVLRFAEITPDVDLDVMRADQSLDALAARLLVQLGQTFDLERPDRVVVQGDTSSAMAAALAACHRSIPVSHVEAGLRSGDLMRPCPEEANRRIISVIADQHFAPTELDAEALRREGVASKRIHVTGNTVVDALLATRDRIAADPTLASALDGTARRFAGKRIVTVTTHRRESRGGATQSITAALRELATRADVAFVIPVHPAAEVREAMHAALGDLNNVALIEPLDYPSFVRLLTLSHLIMTDSGGVQEEAPAFGKPVLVMRDTTERPQAIEAGTAKLVGTTTERIVAEASRLLDDAVAYAAMAKAHSPFGDGRAAERIAALLETKLGS